MAEIDPVILELVARNDRYLAELRNTTRVAEQQLGQQERRVQQLEQQVRQSSGAIGSSFRALAGPLATAFSAREIVRMADTWSDLSSQVGVAIEDMERAPEVMNRIAEVARVSYSSLEQTAEAFARNNRTLSQMGYNTEAALRFTEALNNALVATATRGDRARQVQDSLSKAIATGKLEAEGLENILAHGGAVAESLARHLGVTTNQLYKLRAEGKITGDVIVQSLINNFDDLRAQAETMPATVSDGFIILRNELTRYLGETDKALGATERMAQALIALGDNIDVVAKAVAVLGVVMLGRWVGPMVAGRAAAIAGSASLRLYASSVALATQQVGVLAGAQVALNGAMAGTAVAARGAGAAILAAFGGPVGLAVAALAAGVIYYATQVESAAEKTERLTKAAADAAKEADRMEGRLRAAGVAIKDTGNAATVAARDMDGFSKSIVGTIQRMQQLARQAEITQLAMLGQRRLEIEQERRDVARSNVVASAQLAGGALPIANVNLANGPVENRQLAELAREDAAIQRQMQAILTGMENNVNVLDDAAVATATAAEEEKKTAKEKAAKGPTAADIEQRHQDELSRLRQEEIAARLALTDGVRERADLQQDLLREEYVQRSSQLANDEYFTAEQKRAQQAILDALYGYMRDTQGNIIQGAPGLYQQDVRRELEQREADMARDILAMRADALEAQADLATTLDQRRFLESAALDIGHQIERSLLEEAIAQGRIAEAAKARALLGERQAAEREGLRRDNMSAGERYVFDLRNRDINEALEGIEVAGLERLNDELAEAITGAKSLGEAFKNVAQQIIQDLARIAIQQAVIKPLAGALFGGGGGGLLSGIPGFAAGGTMRIGGRGGTDQNLLSLNGQPIARVSQGEYLNIAPNQRAASAPGGGGMKQEIYVDARGAVMNDQFAAQILRQAKAWDAETSVKTLDAANRSAPSAVQSAQRYGRR